MAKKLQWSLIEAKIELMREKANLVREQVQTQKEITRGTLLKNRLMELEIEKIEEEREQEKNAPKNSVVHGRIIGIDPGIQREEPPDKRPRRQVSFLKIRFLSKILFFIKFFEIKQIDFLF